VQRLATVTFRLGDLPHGLVAAYLGAEHGIGVRSGCFCAHPLLLRLLEVDPVQAEAWHAAMRRGEDVELPGATRASFGLGATQDDVERLAVALERLVADGPRWTYRPDGHSGGWLPDPDPRGADAVLRPPPHR
jgi:selenocysteine lyase/cysteine desulfurase